MGTAVHGAISITGCTIFGNLLGNSSGGQADAAGAVAGTTTIRDSIIWNNEIASFSANSLPNVSYSIVAGGAAGLGNLDLDPLFVDAANGDFYLALGSPAIDSADPAGSLDPDGTRADMGSEYFVQIPAAAAQRNGTGLNPLVYTSSNTPVIGSSWIAQVDTSGFGFPVLMSRIYAYGRASAPRSSPYGEFLVDLSSSLVGISTAFPVAGNATHSIGIPLDYSLVGRSLATQAAVFGSTIRLTNALDLTAGL